MTHRNTAAHHKTAQRFLIRGHVQGVSYRAFAVHSAQETGVTGWTRNLDDGGVEVQANGTANQLSDFEARLRKGPRWAEVRGVEVEEIAAFSASGFHIR